MEIQYDGRYKDYSGRKEGRAQRGAKLVLEVESDAGTVEELIIGPNDDPVAVVSQFKKLYAILHATDGAVLKFIDAKLGST